MPLVDLRVRHLCALLLGCWAANKLPLRLHPEDRDNQEKKETYMSKNLTRKGLALGAVVALATTLFAAAPAHATGESAGILVAPNAGTTYTSIKGSTFDLSTVVSSSLAAEKLTYLITNSSGATVNASFKGAGTAGYQSIRTGATAATVGDSTDTQDAINSTYNTAAKAIVVTGRSNAATNYGVNETASTKNHLVLWASADGTDNVVLTVQAFLDANRDGLINNLDAYSAPVDVTFIPASSVVATTTITSGAIGSSTLQASVSLANVNEKNLPSGALKLQVKKDGSVFQFTGAVDSVDLGYSTADGVTENSVTGTQVQLGAGVYVAQAYFGAVADGIKVGAASNASTTAAATNASIDGTDLLAVANSANTKYTAAVTNTRAVASSGSTKIRTGFTGAIAFSTYVMSLDAGDTAVSGNVLATAGISVRVTLNGSGLTGTDTFTAGGKTVSATSTSAYFDTVTDATGKVAFTGSASAGTKSDSVTVSVAVLKGSAYAAADANVVTWNDAIVQNPVLTSGVIGFGADSNLKIAKGASYALNYAVADDFGQLVTAAGYRLNVAYTTLGNTAAVNAAAAVTAGKASVTIADDSATTGSSYTVTAKLQKLNTAGTAWENSTVATGTAVANVYVSTKVAATVTADVPTASQATITKTLVDADLRVDGNTNSAALIGYSGTTVTVSGVVTDATGSAIAGQDVTIAGANLGFISVDTKVYKVGSITVQTDSTGKYSVAVFTTTAGKASLTVTAGAATVTKSITYTGITSLAETNVLSLDVASLSQVGRSVTVTVKLVDKYGNAVTTAADKVAIAVTGVGSLSAKTLTIDKGAATVQFVAGANDFGDAVITAKYTATDAAETVVSVTKTLTIGVTDAQVDVVNNRVTAVASFSKGKTVGFYVDGVKKWSKLSASDADVVLNYNLKKGTHTVTVKISGGFVTTEKFIVK
jgi:hypothetical protein